MARVPVIEVVRRAYKIWEAAGRPDGKDQEFYFQAERELEDELSQEQTESPAEQAPHEERWAGT